MTIRNIIVLSFLALLLAVPAHAEQDPFNLCGYSLLAHGYTINGTFYSCPAEVHSRPEPFAFLLTEICDCRQCYPNAAPCLLCTEGTMTTTLLTFTSKEACEVGRENLGRTLQGSGLLRQPDECFSLITGTSR